MDHTPPRSASRSARRAPPAVHRVRINRSPARSPQRLRFNAVTPPRAHAQMNPGGSPGRGGGTRRSRRKSGKTRRH